MDRSRVLLIGGTRNVGYQLTWRLLAMGAQVTLLNRGTMQDPFGQQVTRIQTDRTTDVKLTALGSQCFDAVVDFAGYTGADAQQAVDVFGRDRVGHYVFISSGQVYLVREGCQVPAREEDYAGTVLQGPPTVADTGDYEYGMAKREAEDILAQAWESERFPSTRLRIPVVNSERDHYRRLESYLWRILDGQPLLLPDGGTKVLRQVYSGSVVTAITQMLGRTEVFGEALNITQEEMPTLRRLLEMVAGILGTSLKGYAVSSEDLREMGLSASAVSPFSGRWTSCLDGTKAKERLGFEHEPLHNYLSHIVAAFLNHPPQDKPSNYAHRRAEVAWLRDHV